MTQHPNDPEKVSAGLRKVLNMHGYGFHYAVMRRAEEISLNQKNRWVLIGAEFPIVAGGVTTHIDFILQSKTGRTYLIAECKRADPAKARWCFSRAPYTWRNPSSEEVIFEQFDCRPANILISNPRIGHTARGIYHIGLELKTGNPGEGLAQSGPAINQAVTQVLRGTSGLINHLFEFSRRSYSSETTFRFIPVIFSTAELWVTDADLGAADLATGDLEAVRAQKVDWIWFTHNRSPNLRHDVERNVTDENLSKELRREFARSIAIVSPEGIDKFLEADLESWLD